MNRTNETVDLLTGLMRMLTRYPDKARFKVIILGPAVIVRVTPVKQDYGKIVGTGGVVIRALKFIGKEASGNSDFEIILEESTKSAEGPPTLVWNEKSFVSLVEKTARLIFTEASFEWNHSPGSNIVAIGIGSGYDTSHIYEINKTMTDLFGAIAAAGRRTAKVWISETETVGK